MTSKGQSSLTDHFVVKKKLPQTRSRKLNDTNGEVIGLVKKNDEAKISPIESVSAGKKRKLDLVNRVQKELLSKRPKTSSFDNLNSELKAKIRNRLKELRSEVSNSAVKRVEKIEETESEFLQNNNVTSSHISEDVVSFDTKNVSKLTIPYKYKVLEAMFSSADVAISMMYNRHETCAFPKIKRAVQEMIRRNFDLRHVAQISKVYPEAYSFSQEKCNAFNYDEQTKQNYQLVITPKLGVSSTLTNADISKAKTFKNMTPSILLERRHQFAKNLIEILKDHHETFLQSLETPMSVEREKLIRWHPNFNVNSVPDIGLNPLPEPPTRLKNITAKDVLEKSRAVFGERIENALKEVAKKYDKTNDKSENPKSQLAPALRGLPQSLIDKIRAKETVMLQDKMTTLHKDTKKEAMLAKLPQLARIIRMYFIGEKKAAILLDDVVIKIQDSLVISLSPADIKEHIQLMSDVMPEWILLLNVGNKIYLKIDKDKNLNVILNKLKL